MDAMIKAAEFADTNFKTMQDVMDYLKDDPNALIRIDFSYKDGEHITSIVFTYDEWIRIYAPDVKIKDHSAMSHSDGKHWTAIITI